MPSAFAHAAALLPAEDTDQDPRLYRPYDRGHTAKQRLTLDLIDRDLHIDTLYYPYMLRVRYLGYAPHEEILTLAPGDRSTRSVRLVPAPLLLEGVSATPEGGAVRRELGRQRVTPVLAWVHAVQIALTSERISRKSARLSVIVVVGVGVTVDFDGDGDVNLAGVVIGNCACTRATCSRGTANIPNG